MKNIVFEDDNIIVAYKPAGIATQTARIGQRDMVSELKNYLAKKPENKGKGEPYLGLVHRLDQPVSGLLAFAKTKQAAAALSSQLSDGRMEKTYYAVISGAPAANEGQLTDYLYKDPKTNQSEVVGAGFPGAKKAALEYKMVRTLMVFGEDTQIGRRDKDFSSREVSLMQIRLITGRHHQIRAQMSHAGMPLLGDNKYGDQRSKDLSREIGCRTVALCAYRLTFFHPATGEKLVFEKQPENEIFLPFFSTGI